MKNFLRNYLQYEANKPVKNNFPGPVITISRECGCSAKRIATKLSKILTGYSFQSETKTDIEWKWISKEIIEAAAHELEIAPEKIRNVFQSEAKISLEDVSTAFSTDKVYDAEDQQVIDTMRKVILQLAEEGNCIIVDAFGARAGDGHAPRASGGRAAARLPPHRSAGRPQGARRARNNFV